MAWRVYGRLAAIVIGSIVCAGCGPSRPATVPVRGTVTLDGAPVAGAAVLFMPEQGRPAEAVTDAAGAFVLRTFEKDDGAVPGSHRVTVTLAAHIDAPKVNSDGLENPGPAPPAQTRWIVPQRYSRPETSGLSCVVAAGMAPVPLDLSSRPDH